MSNLVSSLPKISIITPVYNGSEYLDQMIQSVMVQKNINLEHIIIDDGSDDGNKTVDILGKYKHLRWWTRENKGQYATLNEGIKAASGDWILVISADDLLFSDSAISELLEILKKDASINAVVGNTRLINEKSELLNDYGRPTETSPKWINYYYLLIHHCSMLVSRDFIERNNLLFDESLKYTGDWDWIIRILKLGKVDFIDMNISKYRIHSLQTRIVTKNNHLKNEDRIILKRYKSSIYIRQIIIYFYRIKKIILLIHLNGFSESFNFLKKFITKNKYPS